MIRTNVPSVVDEETGCYPPIGLLYVAAAAEAAGHEVHVIDAVASGLDASGVAADVARQAAVRPTVVLSDKAVEAIVRARPTTLEELAEVRDVGPSTRERHGARLLAIVAEHAGHALPDQDAHALSAQPTVRPPGA